MPEESSPMEKVNLCY